MWKGKLIFVVVLFVLYNSSYAQDPNYFVLGASEFKNADIYSILHTQNKKLYIATNEGLYEYKHGRMFQIDNAKEQRDISLFNLVENNKNEVFCFNLNGQIFKIEDNALKLYFQIPEKYYREHIEMFFDDTGRLIVSSGGCFAISKDSLEEIFFSEEYKNIQLTKLLNGDIILSIPEQKKIIKIKDGKAKLLQTDFFENNNYNRSKILEFNNKLVAPQQLLNKSSEIKEIYRQNEYFKHHQISTNEIWARSNFSGIIVYRSKNDSAYYHKRYFPNIFISMISLDDSGAIFLGTFGKGLFVIPNRKAETYDNIFTGNNFQHITSDDQNIYISDKVEGIYVYNNSKNQVDLLDKYRPNKIFTFEKNRIDLYKGYPNLFHGNKIGNGDVKNIFELDSTSYLLATSNGIFKFGNAKIIDDKLWNKTNFRKHGSATISKLFKKRCTDVAFDPTDEALYVSTMSFLKVLRPNDQISELSFNEFPIIANDIFFEDGLLWCATQNFGILVFKNNKIVKQINTETGLGNNYVFKLEKRSDHLYISHKTGFQIYSIATQEWMTIGTAEGVENGTVKDFCVQGEKIWFISNNQIISYPINNINFSKPEMRITYDSIKVNDAIVSHDTPGKFNHNENNVTIYPIFSGLLYESEVKLQFTLENTQNNQILQSNPISINDNLIEFKYLPSGDYKFHISALYRGNESRSESYQFSINKAYWQTSWFLITCLLLTIALIGIFIKFRTRKINRENLEKLEKQSLKTEAIKAELKALRSQMNPHFIFNSLNSIQDLILKQDTDASYDYLVLFSELVRNALAYSNQNLISIEKEILFLQSYLKLEKLRFGTEFEFSISNKVPNGLAIPSLVIQPFVENAIAHGVFHKKGDKTIDIKLYTTEENLVCTISDNGMGRAYSKKMRARNSNNHKSYALNAILKRLQFLKIEYGNNIGFEINDIVHNEDIIGTKVIVHLPKIEKKNTN